MTTQSDFERWLAGATPEQMREALRVRQEVAEEVASALDAAGGDTDPPGDPEEWRDDYPDLWAVYKLRAALSHLPGREGE